jgi:hypothetical protein
MSDLTYEYPAEVVMQRARESRAMQAEVHLLRDVLTRLVAEFTFGDKVVQCSHCGEPVEMCRCIIDLARTALGGREGAAR